MPRPKASPGDRVGGTPSGRPGIAGPDDDSMSDAEIKTLVQNLDLPESAEEIFKRLRKEEEEKKRNPAVIELEAKLEKQRAVSN